MVQLFASLTSICWNWLAGPQQQLEELTSCSMWHIYSKRSRSCLTYFFWISAQLRVHDVAWETYFWGENGEADKRLHFPLRKCIRIASSSLQGLLNDSTTRFFYLCFYHGPAPYGLLIHTLKYFEFGFKPADIFNSWRCSPRSDILLDLVSRALTFRRILFRGTKSYGVSDPTPPKKYSAV